MAYLDSTINTGQSAQPSVAVPTGGGALQANDIVVLVTMWDSGSGTFDDADYPGGAGVWTELAEITQGPDGGKISVAWKRLTGADSGTYTFINIGTSGTDWVCQAFAFRGRDTGNPPVLTATNNTTANGSPVTATVPSVTALTGDDLLTFVGPDVSASGVFDVFSSRPSGYTADEAAEVGFASLAGDHLDNAGAGATGTKTYVFSLTSGTSGWYAGHIRIPAAGGGGGTTLTPGAVAITLTGQGNILGFKINLPDEP